MAYSDELAKNIPALPALFATKAPGEVDDLKANQFVLVFRDHAQDRLVSYHSRGSWERFWRRGYVYIKGFDNYFHAYAFSQKVKKLIG